MQTPHVPTPPDYLRAAQDFYSGMAEAAQAIDSQFIPALREAFASRDYSAGVEKAIRKPIGFSKILTHPQTGMPHVPAPHHFPQVKAEYFACIAALNLYRLPQYVEQFKVELLTEHFLQCCIADEKNWLELSHASTPDFARETGHQPNHWRSDAIARYLRVLERKSSRDADTTIAVNRLLSRLDLTKAHGAPASPALLESLAKKLESPAGWLARYAKFRPF